MTTQHTTLNAPARDTLRTLVGRTSCPQLALLVLGRVATIDLLARNIRLLVGPGSKAALSLQIIMLFLD